MRTILCVGLSIAREPVRHAGIDEPSRQLLRQHPDRILLSNVEERTGLSSTPRHARAGAALDQRIDRDLLQPATHAGASQLPIAGYVHAALISESGRRLTRWPPRIPSDLKIHRRGTRGAATRLRLHFSNQFLVKTYCMVVNGYAPVSQTHKNSDQPT